MLDSSTGPKPPQMGLPSNFAASQGANILVVMAVVLFVVGCGALVIGHTTLAVLFILVGLVTVAVAARLRGLATVTLDFLKGKFSVTFKRDANDDAHRPSDSTDA
ncbi:MAG TPA: hypothetical protein VGX26_08665 [Solirubrobacteraceae bacterium]|nr:hypothetical protein [Solirubrobacteraceae bacterium]